MEQGQKASARNFRLLAGRFQRVPPISARTVYPFDLGNGRKGDERGAIVNKEICVPSNFKALFAAGCLSCGQMGKAKIPPYQVSES